MKRSRKAAHLAYLQSLDERAKRKLDKMLDWISERAAENDLEKRARMQRQVDDDLIALGNAPDLDDLIALHNRSQRAVDYFRDRASAEEREALAADEAEYQALLRSIAARVEKMIAEAA